MEFVKSSRHTVSYILFLTNRRDHRHPFTILYLHCHCPTLPFPPSAQTTVCVSAWISVSESPIFSTGATVFSSHSSHSHNHERTIWRLAAPGVSEGVYPKISHIKQGRLWSRGGGHAGPPPPHPPPAEESSGVTSHLPKVVNCKVGAWSGKWSLKVAHTHPSSPS